MFLQIIINFTYKVCRFNIFTNIPSGKVLIKFLSIFLKQTNKQTNKKNVFWLKYVQVDIKSQSGANPGYLGIKRLKGIFLLQDGMLFLYWATLSIIFVIICLGQ